MCIYVYNEFNGIMKGNFKIFGVYIDDNVNLIERILNEFYLNEFPKYFGYYLNIY